MSTIATSFSCARSPMELGTPVGFIDEVEHPMAAAFNKDGELVVAEWDCISVFNMEGEKLRSFGSRGRGQGEFVSLYGITLDKEGNILVIDSIKRSVLKFTAEGKFVAEVGTCSGGDLDFLCPTDIAFSASNSKLYIADGQCVKMLNSDLTFSGKFSIAPEGEGVSTPWSIDFDHTGKVYVTSHHCIQVFTAEGGFLRKFGSRGSGRGELDNPAGIAMNASGIFVCDCGNMRISVFTHEGDFVTSFGKEGKKRSEFRDLFHLAVNDKGVVCVCDIGAGCIKMF